jgi:pilus assembly protein FimV
MMVAPGGASALGLGGLDRKSRLNEPFEASIELQGAKPDELSTLTVKLADADRFRRAGLERTEVLSQLRFEVVTEGGRSFVKVTSQLPIREPFLNFLLDVNWSKGRLFREFTVLLDPPIYDPNTKIATQTPSKTETPPKPAPSLAVPPKPLPKPESQASIPAPQPAPAAAPAPTLRADTPASADSYGPTTRGETLSKIAQRVRRDKSVSVHQVLVALLRANPDAFFVRDNMNALKRGVVLKVPEVAAASAVSKEEALEQVKQQYALWEEYRQTLAGRVTQRPVGSGSSQGQTTAAKPSPLPADPLEIPVAKQSEEARLKLAAADVVGKVDGSEISKLRNDLTIASESLVSTKEENTELQSKLTEADELIKLLQRQVQVKDEELAALQSKLARDAAQEKLPAPAPSATETVPPAQVEAEPAKDQAATDQPKEDEAARPESPPAEEKPQTSIQPEEPAPGAEDEKSDEDSTIAQPEPPVGQTPPDGDGLKDDVGEPATDSPIASTEPATPPAEQQPQQPSAGSEGGIQGLLQQWLPEGFLASVPGGATTILGGAALALLFLIISLLALVGKRREERLAYEEDAGFDKPDDFEQMLVSDQEAAFTPVAEEPTGEFSRVAVKSDNTLILDEVVSVPPEGPKGRGFTEDPLSEINVYLAYERYDQAEELVKQAIMANPDNHEYMLRLLEVYYASGNKWAYEDYARELYDAVGAQGPLWDSAVAMWKEMSPNRALFQTSKGAEDWNEKELAVSREFVDITGGNPSTEGASEARNQGEFLDLTGAAQDADLSRYSDSFVDITAPSGDENTVDAAGRRSSYLGQTPGNGVQRDDSPRASAGDEGEFLQSVFDISSEKPAGAAEFNDKVVPFDITGGPSAVEDIGAMPTMDTGRPVPPGDASGQFKLSDNSIEFDLRDVDFETVEFDKGDSVAFSSANKGYGEGMAAQGKDKAWEEVAEYHLSDIEPIDITGGLSDTDISDELDTKLNLAKAYIELGDADGAKSILGEVTKEGSDEQKQEAQQLLRQIG